MYIYEYILAVIYYCSFGGQVYVLVQHFSVIFINLFLNEFSHWLKTSKLGLAPTLYFMLKVFS